MMAKTEIENRDIEDLRQYLAKNRLFESSDPIKKYDHDSIIFNYFYSKNRENYCTGSRIFFRGNTLYSFGTHFALCEKCQNGYVINADKYSRTTSGHQTQVITRSPPNTPQIPFSALYSAGINPSEITIISSS